MQTSKAEDENKDAPHETISTSESVLSTGSFTRFDLFGKHDNEETKEEVDNDPSKDASAEKSSEDKTESEKESTSVPVAVSDSSVAEASKSLAAKIVESSDEVVEVHDGGLSSYDFNLLDAGYV